MTNDIHSITTQIKAEAERLGFSACGVAQADAVDNSHAQHFKQWLTNGHNAGMAYMNNYYDKRLDPRLLMEGCQSIISVALNYYPETKLGDSQYQFALYAYGKDYHDVMKEKLSQLATFISQSLFPNTQLNIKACVDTAPILERYWAIKAGIGWIGKNHMLILPDKGSFFFLGELLIDQPLQYDSPITPQCGNCSLCLSKCPHGAITAQPSLNANRCLSYLTIEHKGEIPTDFSINDKDNNYKDKYIYGCDRCQLECPHNRFATPTSINEFNPSSEFISMTPQAWQSLTREEYQKLFRGSAVKRVKYDGLMRNIKFFK